MSLSSKLRVFRKTLRKSIEKKSAVFDDDQLRSVARHMPREKDELSKHLSQDQMKIFGDDMLKVTLAHTSRDQAKFEECILEIGAFERGGLPGMERLDRVYISILRHYGVEVDMEEVFEALKIYVHPTQNKIKRKRVNDDECEEEGNPPFSQRIMSSQ